MKKLIYTFIILITLFPSLIFGKYHLNTEYKYLKHLNRLMNEKLIQGNIHNAESMAEQIISSKEKISYESNFFLELADNYFLIDNNEDIFFSVLRQRCIFPSKILTEKSIRLLKESAIRLKFNESLLNNIILKTKKIPPVQDRRRGIEMLLKYTIKSHAISKKNILKYIHLLNNYDEEQSPFWLKQWQFFNTIEISFHEIPLYINFSIKKGQDEEFISFQSTDLKKKLLLKAIHYFYKHGMYKTASKYLDKYYKEKITNSEIIRADSMKKTIRNKLLN